MEIKATLNKPYTENQKNSFIVQYNHNLGYEIQETEEALEAWGYTEDEQTARREVDFKMQFFEVQNYGWYRRVPKGYGSAVESMNVLFNIASVSQGIQAGLIIFYETPDFSDPEQCTEEWLVQHQIVMPAMTLQEFMQLYIAFMTAWNTQEHIEGIE